MEADPRYDVQNLAQESFLTKDCVFATLSVTKKED
jgi:hypothetical protein